ncbi:MAG: DUF2079 domain-containing protein, partial [Candidatus Omnitrophica bacterium]|nr:DUF2079 domain-containing protein [Candidatus Omnitrophota bacterium]
MEPIFFPLSLLYLIFSNPCTLLVTQSIFIALGAWPLYLIARDRFKSETVALCFASAYLLYPTLQYANLFDFHGDALAPAFFL